MMRALLLCAGLVAALPALAKAPDTSLRPVPRPAATQAIGTATTKVISLRPHARPVRRKDATTTQVTQKTAQITATQTAASARNTEAARPANLDRPGAASKPQASSTGGGGLFKSLRPLLRSGKVTKEARAIRRTRKKGAVCGDLAIQGTPVGRVTGHINGCGVENAVSVRSVSGVALSKQSVMDCNTAKRLKHWVDAGLKPSVGRRGGGVAKIKVAAHYSCRTRNNKRGAKLSEHGKGRAIDISGLYLRDGTEVSVLKHWNSRTYGKMMRDMHRTACGPFGTVLGPKADRHHLDHFHFDTARYRSGAYCR